MKVFVVVREWRLGTQLVLALPVGVFKDLDEAMEAAEENLEYEVRRVDVDAYIPEPDWESDDYHGVWSLRGPDTSGVEKPKVKDYNVYFIYQLPVGELHEPFFGD